MADADAVVANLTFEGLTGEDALLALVEMGPKAYHVLHALGLDEWIPDEVPDTPSSVPTLTIAELCSRAAADRERVARFSDYVRERDVEALLVAAIMHGVKLTPPQHRTVARRSDAPRRPGVRSRRRARAPTRSDDEPAEHVGVGRGGRPT